jgi:hypothetical protein
MSLWQTKSWQEMLLKSHQTERYFEIDGVFFDKQFAHNFLVELHLIWLYPDSTIGEKLPSDTS